MGDVETHAALPEGWSAASDDATGATYYYHTSGAVQWEPPVEPPTPPPEPPEESLLILKQAAAAGAAFVACEVDLGDCIPGYKFASGVIGTGWKWITPALAKVTSSGTLTFAQDYAGTILDAAIYSRALYTSEAVKQHRDWLL